MCGCKQALVRLVIFPRAERLTSNNGNFASLTMRMNTINIMRVCVRERETPLLVFVHLLNTVCVCPHADV